MTVISKRKHHGTSFGRDDETALLEAAQVARLEDAALKTNSKGLSGTMDPDSIRAWQSSRDSAAHETLQQDDCGGVTIAHREGLRSLPRRPHCPASSAQQDA